MTQCDPSALRVAFGAYLPVELRRRTYLRLKQSSRRPAARVAISTLSSHLTLARSNDETRRMNPRAGRDPTRDRSAPGGGPLRPKQSLGQNFLRDVAMVRRIVDAFDDSRAQLCPSARVVEVGPGTGALTGMLLERFPEMRALEIDQRAVSFLRDSFPALNVDHVDVLDVDWAAVAAARRDPTFQGTSAPLPVSDGPSEVHPSEHVGTVNPSSQGPAIVPSAVIGNLPYNIVSQILFSLFEAPAPTVALAVVMMQREVADRIVARPRTKAYGILSVVGQLYSKPEILFGVPPTVFSPQPKIESAMVRFDFEAHPELDVYNTTLTGGLRLILRASFQQRRKVLRNSLRKLCEAQNVELPERWSSRRPEELPPPEFIDLTRYVFARDLASPVVASASSSFPRPDKVWRQPAKSPTDIKD